MIMVVLHHEEKVSNKKIFQDMIDKHRDINYSKNIKIINLDDFLILLRPPLFRNSEDSAVLNKIPKARDLGLFSIEDDDKYGELIKQSKKHTKMLRDH